MADCKGKAPKLALASHSRAEELLPPGGQRDPGSNCLWAFRLPRSSPIDVPAHVRA